MSARQRRGASEPAEATITTATDNGSRRSVAASLYPLGYGAYAGAMRRALLLLVTALLGLTTVTACSGSTAAPTIDSTGATMIDVRTPAEYAEGHLDGAVNIDIQDQALFEAAIADLDPDAAYVVYCRSGNRSAAATAQMTAAGFTDVTDAGGLQAASAATGLEIVTD